MASLSLSILEIIILMLGAVFLGITIHFFIVSRRNLKKTITTGTDRNLKDLEQWKVRYFNDIEYKEKELASLRKQLEETEQSSKVYSMEYEELRRENRRLTTELENSKKSPVGQGSTGFLEQLKLTQDNLVEQNLRITQLLEQIEIIKEKEHKTDDLVAENQELSSHIDELKRILSDKEKELSNSQQKQVIAVEMSSILDNAYREFNVLQEKIEKLESQVSSSRIKNLDYENLKEEHYNLLEELERGRAQLSGLTQRNQELQILLTETENKLRDTNFQRQQLQKKVGYLEELTHDMQLVAETNKKLQGQLKRMGELESRLNVISEERDELMRRQISSQ